MSLLSQKTIKNTLIFKGIGLHTGEEVKIKIKPAQPNTGIIFKRVDLDKNNLVIPNIFNVSDASFCTTISNEAGVKVSTIEHLMAAFYGIGLDNAIIEINAQEVPIMDGSSKKFIEEISKTGLVSHEVPIKIIKIEKKVEFKDGEKYISIDKSNVSLDIDFEINFNNPLIGKQSNKINVYEDDLSDIYSSRTFCLYEDIKKLKEMGLAKGGSLENAIVVKKDKVLNENGLRNDKEFVNHKILDCIGDIYLTGCKVIGSIQCSQGGHKLTNQLLRKVFQDKSNFSIFEIKEKNIPHTFVNKSHLKSIA
tara:strand:- start:2587 stop:3507 length:921 start_codon:yes stop_codon:yes gene_type:complete